MIYFYKQSYKSSTIFNLSSISLKVKSSLSKSETTLEIVTWCNFAHQFVLSVESENADCVWRDFRNVEVNSCKDIRCNDPLAHSLMSYLCFLFTSKLKTECRVSKSHTQWSIGGISVRSRLDFNWNWHTDIAAITTWRWFEHRRKLVPVGTSNTVANFLPSQWSVLETCDKTHTKTFVHIRFNRYCNAVIGPINNSQCNRLVCFNIATRCNERKSIWKGICVSLKRACYAIHNKIIWTQQAIEKFNSCFELHTFISVTMLIKTLSSIKDKYHYHSRPM